ncbi:heme biosynthesis HemY N-terminal domain-containing protein [Govanella unica]|uniref:HemY N-terminal domain-containing protein n=1 Tax=Govanella unica TaxID=2975056 RepID=A0A9X3TZ52_9PROT|nr:heme biosynthesis HemY N-terminal domain-containing protein [Govania unica]MDA5194473.1 hypothetical protein [Govania unica]
MRRLLLIMILAFVAAVAAAWLADHPGHAVIDWQDWRIEMSAVTLTLLIMGLTFVMLLLFRLLIWLFRDTPFAPEQRRARRQRKGMEAVHEALAALGGGRGRDATRNAEDAIKNLGATPLTLLLRAEAAHLKKDLHGAHEALSALAEREDSGVLGFRGLVALALQNNDLAEARALLAAAQTRDTDSLWVRELSNKLAVREGRWTEARAALKDLRRLKAIEPTEADRQEAALAQAEAVEADLAGNGTEALDFAREALKLDPRLTPAAVLAARLARGAGRSGMRDSILKDAWIARPHPDLLRAALQGIENEIPATKLHRLAEITGPDSILPEARLMRATLALEDEDWDAARLELDALLRAGHPSAEVYELLATLETAEHGDSIRAAEWQRTARTATHDKHWTCGDCGATRPHWAAVCTSCGGLGTLDWQTPGDLPLAATRRETFGLLAG